MTPSAALHKASKILRGHFEKVSAVEVKQVAAAEPEKKSKKK